MVSDWKEVTLDSLVDFTPKRTIKKGILAPFVSMADINENSKYIPKFFEKEYKGGGSRFKNGDTLFARITPCLQNGKCSKVTGLLDNSIAHGSTEFIVMAAKKPEFDSDFIYYLARTPHFRAFAESRMIGSTGRQRVSWQDLAEYELIAPRQHERKLIGEVLSKFDEKIELNRQMNETLEEMVQTLFKSWFVDFDPVIDNALLAGNDIPEPLKERAELRQAQLDSGQANSNSEINDLFPSEFEFTEDLGWIPKGWSVHSLDQLCSTITDGSHSSPKSVNEGYPMASVKDMNNWGFNLDTCRIISETDYLKLKKNGCQPLKNDVLIAKDGSYLKHIFVMEDDLELVTLSSIAILRPNLRINPHFLKFTLKREDVHKRMENYVSGAVIQRIVLRDFRKFEIVVPPESLQSHWFEITRGIFESCWNNIHQNGTLAKLRDTLLPKLMSGELRIADAEKLVENI